MLEWKLASTGAEKVLRGVGTPPVRWLARLERDSERVDSSAAEDTARIRPTWAGDRLEREYTVDLEREEARREALSGDPEDFDAWFLQRRAAARRLFAQASEE